MKIRDSLTMRHAILRKLVFFSVLVTCYSLLLPGCGWRLRGSIELPPAMDKTYIQGTARYSELGMQIYNAFQGANISLVGSPGQATAILHILGEKAERRILATDSAGRASEYEVSYELSYKVTDVKGDNLVPNQKVKSKREYRFDPNNVLASDSEVKRLQKDMIRFSVQQMLRRINASLRSKQLTQ